MTAHAKTLRHEQLGMSGDIIGNLVPPEHRAHGKVIRNVAGGMKSPDDEKPCGPFQGIHSLFGGP